MTKSSTNPVTAKLLIVEDDAGHAEAMQEGLARQGHTCTVASNGHDAIKELQRDTFDIVITDLMLGTGPDGLAVQLAAKENQPDAKIVVVTANPSVETCRTALHEGAFDYIEKPLDLEELRSVVHRACEVTTQRQTVKPLRQELDELYGFEDIIAQSAGMLKILETVQKVAPSDLPVLLLGKSGTGKDLLANALHSRSRRAEEPLVAINCAGLNESLLEDELFGHVKGAFTGATTDRPGRFEHASGGTLFLDEIGDMPLAMQAKLLRVLENGEVVRVGSNEPIRVNVRIVSATNCDLEEKVANKEFREDLYFRIKGVTIEVPPLTQRREDIPLLIEHFIKLANERHGTKVKGIAADAQRVLLAYPWPGNIRQLRNVVENMVVLASDTRLSVDDIPSDIFDSKPGQEPGDLSALAGMSLEEAEKQLIANTLTMVDGNRERAANILGIGERTLYRKIKEYGLNP
jgi:DNA-binding NtrC family response regulator